MSEGGIRERAILNDLIGAALRSGQAQQGKYHGGQQPLRRRFHVNEPLAVQVGMMIADPDSNPKLLKPRFDFRLGIVRILAPDLVPQSIPPLDVDPQSLQCVLT
jgi:hypothetical protein